MTALLVISLSVEEEGRRKSSETLSAAAGLCAFGRCVCVFVGSCIVDKACGVREMTKLWERGSLLGERREPATSMNE